MRRTKRILWFAFRDLDSASVRYRAQYPLEYFSRVHQIDHKLVIPGYGFEAIVNFIWAYLQALFCDRRRTVIVVQRVSSSFLYANLLLLLARLKQRNVIYDLDDADYLYLDPKNIYRFVQLARVVSAGSKEIAKYLEPINPRIILTTSPTPDLAIVKGTKNKVLRIGWIGDLQGDHRCSLSALVFPALLELSFETELVLLGVPNEVEREDIKSYFEGSQVSLIIPLGIDWRDEKWIQSQISSFDIGISTLLDTPIQRSKSGIKAKQYLNNGVPVLGTCLPENDWVIQHGHNGYFCSNSVEFRHRIEQFNKMDATEYTEFSKRARASIVHFDHEKYYEQFLAFEALSGNKEAQFEPSLRYQDML